jgi:predicted RNA-binding protein with PUA-like domain
MSIDRKTTRTPPGPASRFWLVKSDPNAFSIDDLSRSSGQRTCWDGVRNYQARNYLRAMRVGDQVLFYHSNADPPAVMGVVEVVREAYPDPTAFDPADRHFDPNSDPANPTWVMVDLKLARRFVDPLPLDLLRRRPGLQHMELLRKGSRLSVQPVRPREWDIICTLTQQAERARDVRSTAPERRASSSPGPRG